MWSYEKYLVTSFAFWVLRLSSVLGHILPWRWSIFFKILFPESKHIACRLREGGSLFLVASRGMQTGWWYVVLRVVCSLVPETQALTDKLLHLLLCVTMICYYNVLLPNAKSFSSTSDCRICVCICSSRYCVELQPQTQVKWLSFLAHVTYINIKRWISVANEDLQLFIHWIVLMGANAWLGRADFKICTSSTGHF